MMCTNIKINYVIFLVMLQVVYPVMSCSQNLRAHQSITAWLYSLTKQRAGKPSGAQLLDMYPIYFMYVKRVVVVNYCCDYLDIMVRQKGKIRYCFEPGKFIWPNQICVMIKYEGFFCQKYSYIYIYT